MSLLSEPTAAAPPRAARRPGRARVALVAVPPLVLLVLGLVQLLQHRPLWYDEAYSRLASGVSLSTLLSGMWHRVGVVSYLMDVPPSFNGPYYVVLHFWVLAFGDSAFSLRFASLGCAVVAVAVLVELVRRLAGPGAAWTAGLLLATSPLVVDETTQARDYGLALLLLSLCALWLHDWASRGRHLPRAVLAAAAAGLIHWFTLPVVVGFAVYAVCTRGRDGRRAALALLVACGPAAALVGWSLVGGAQGAPHPVAVGLSLPSDAIEAWAGGWWFLAVALGAAALAGLWRSPHRLLLVGWVVVPLVLITGVELVRATYYPRYLLFTLTGFAIAAALGIAAIRRPGVRRGLAGSLIALSLAATIPTFTTSAEEPTPETLAYLAAEQTAGQPIVPADGRVSLDLETYLSLQPRLGADLVLPPELFTDQTTSDTVWLVRVVLKENSLPVVPAEQRLIDAGWTLQDSRQLVGTTTDLRVERWTR